MTSPNRTTDASAVTLAWPSMELLPGYVDALERGWSPDNVRAETRVEQLAEIARDPAAFVAKQVDREARAGDVVLPDGSRTKRLPGYHRWIVDGDFCGTVGFRWQPGTEALPPTCLGHIGYSVVPWKRGRGYATRALALILPNARVEGLAYVEVTTDPDNVASQRVIESNGGRRVERFRKTDSLGGSEGLRYRIALAPR